MINSKIKDLRQSLTNTVNDYLQQGMPVGCVELVIEALYHDLSKTTEKAIEMEQQAEQEKWIKEQEAAQSEEVPTDAA